jgi:hypothetical protein
MDEHIKWLESWYEAQCNGDWEHRWGISIETLDNPGWCLRVEVTGTPLESKSFEGLNIERSDNDWVHCRIRDRIFEGFGGPKNLGELIEVFRKWASEASGR